MDKARVRVTLGKAVSEWGREPGGLGGEGLEVGGPPGIGTNPDPDPDPDPNP